jgi:hypothetical protein
VRALQTLVTDAPLRMSMGRAARAFIASSASVRTYATALEGLVHRALALHRDRARAA